MIVGSGTLLLAAGWFICAAIAWVIASQRGFDWWLPWAVTGVLFGPIAIVFAAIVPPPRHDDWEEEPR